MAFPPFYSLIYSSYYVHQTKKRKIEEKKRRLDDSILTYVVQQKPTKDIFGVKMKTRNMYYDLLYYILQKKLGKPSIRQ